MARGRIPHRQVTNSAAGFEQPEAELPADDVAYDSDEMEQWEQEQDRLRQHARDVMDGFTGDVGEEGAARAVPILAAIRNQNEQRRRRAFDIEEIILAHHPDMPRQQLNRQVEGQLRLEGWPAHPVEPAPQPKAKAKPKAAPKAVPRPFAAEDPGRPAPGLPAPKAKARPKIVARPLPFAAVADDAI
jgi:hypothetical protein